jgi:transcriptional regulator GlxA family with amidase domain
MEAAIEERLDAAAIAARAGLGLRQLERLFRRHLGTTIGAFYLDLRLNRARLLLRDSALPLSEIAAATGFASLSHFSRRFATRFGAPPARLRRAMTGGGGGG